MNVRNFRYEIVNTNVLELEDVVFIPALSTNDNLLKVSVESRGLPLFPPTGKRGDRNGLDRMK